MNLPGLQWYQRLNLVRQGVVDPDFVHRVSVNPFGPTNKQPIVADAPQPRNVLGRVALAGAVSKPGLLIHLYVCKGLAKSPLPAVRKERITETKALSEASTPKKSNCSQT